MISLLIADASEDFSSALSASLSETYQVSCCSGGKEALKLLLQQKPDILVLDLMLPELDGLSLLLDAVSAGARPMVLATTTLITPYIQETAEQLGVGYLIRKPCDIQAVTARIGDLSHRLGRPLTVPDDPGTYVSNTLLSLSVSASVKGYGFARYAVLITAEQPGLSVTKELYPMVGKHFGTTDKQVERSIRSAIVSAWERRDDAVWRKFFSPDPDGKLTRPSNSVFISRIAECINWADFSKIRL